MFIAKVFDIFISSPSDVQDERKILEDVIHDWNVINARSRNIILRPVKWESGVYSDFLSSSAQGAINNQTLDTSDILIAVFWSRVGTATAEYESGTIEEFHKHIEKGRPAQVFFSKESLPQNCDRVQFDRLMKFKEWCKSKGVYDEYSSKSEFKDVSRKHLSLLLNNDRYKENLTQIENKIKEQKFSKKKIDAISFVQNIPTFTDNNKLLEEFLDELGNYRSLRLNEFFKETGLLSLSEHSSGFNINISSRMWNLEKKDVQELLEDIKDGEFDHVL